MNIVFMGTPEIAVPALDALHRVYGVVGVFCQPDKPVGRKQTVTPPPVKQYAIEHNIPVFQPTKMRDGTALDMLNSLNPDIAVVMAYGRILPHEMLIAPAFGCINLHASILPKYRGAAPIQRVLENGETETGITVMRMDVGMDTGDIISMHPMTIEPDDDADSLSDKLAMLASRIVAERVEAVVEGRAVYTVQEESLATYAPIVSRTEGVVSFTLSADSIVNTARAFSVWPVARFVYREKTVKIAKAAYSDMSGKPGEVMALKPLTVATANGSVALLEVVPEGARRMTGTEWAAGRRLAVGDSLTEV